MKMPSMIPGILIIFVAALFGASIGKVVDFDQSYSAAVGGFIATIAVGIGALFNTKTKELKKQLHQENCLGCESELLAFV